MLSNFRSLHSPCGALLCSEKTSKTFMQFQIKWNVKQLNTIHYQFSSFQIKLFLFHHDTFDTEVELNSSDIAETSMIRADPRQSPARVNVAEAAIKRWVLKKNDKQIDHSRNHDKQIIKRTTITEWSLEMKEKCMWIESRVWSLYSRARRIVELHQAIIAWLFRLATKKWSYLAVWPTRVNREERSSSVRLTSAITQQYLKWRGSCENKNLN